MMDEAEAFFAPFVTAGVLEPLHVHFAKTLGRLVSGRHHPAHELMVLLGASMASRAPQHGHICVEIRKLPGSVRLETPEDGTVSQLAWPEPETWLAALAASPLVAGEGSDELARPLVLDGDRLYLQRYWFYQRRLVSNLRARIGVPRAGLDTVKLREMVRRLFGEDEDSEPNLQKVAAALAVRQRFCVISGGPGTGKTTTVKRILVLLQELAWSKGVDESRFPLRIALLAPTGKAAARLKESIIEGLHDLPVADAAILNHIPLEAATIHRKLGVQRGSATRFAHDADNPLLVDAVVVDEASMVDLALMTKLLEAVPLTATLILLGDRDQLSSVEAGAVLGDICNTGGCQRQLSRPVQRYVEQVVGVKMKQKAGSTHTGIWDSVFHLTRTFRFGKESGIGALSRAIKEGRADDALSYLRGARTEASARGKYRDIDLIEYSEDSFQLSAIRARVLEAYTTYLRAATQRRCAQDALAAFDRFRVLCAHRIGQLGAQSLNRHIERWLEQAGLVQPQGEWYAGRPILVTHNDYQLMLFNGDIGVLVADEHDPSRVMACFPGASRGEIRRLNPARLPPHETVYAMTVHKSQGSQFNDVIVVLPSRPSRVVTRELVYTAVTRAKEHATLVGTEPVVRQALAESVQRASGLRDLLWGTQVSEAREQLTLPLG